MIFELRFHTSSDFLQKLGFLLQQSLKDEGLSHRIFIDQGVLYLWIECSTLQASYLENLTHKLSTLIPQSLFFKEVHSQVLDHSSLSAHQTFEAFDTFGYCPICLQCQAGQTCPICHKSIQDTPYISEITALLLEGKSVKLTTESGEHILSLKPSQRAYCLNPESILEISNLTPKELQALASYEKPILKVKPSPSFASTLNQDDLYLSLAHDLQLLALFRSLQDVPFLYGDCEFDAHFELATPIQTPLVALILENDAPLILHNPLPHSKLKMLFEQYSKPDKAFLATILEENNLREKNILNFYFSLEGGDKICLYNSQTQWFNEVMDFELPSSLFELFELIAQDGESGPKLIANFQKTFPDLCKQDVCFDGLPRGIMGVWEIVRITLGLPQNPLYLASHHLTQRGVAIDYILTQDSLITHKFGLIKCIRSGMSFKLAGVEDGVIALGYIESFSSLPSNLYLSIKKLIEVDGISLSGDLFSSKMLGDFFYKNNHQAPIYRNISFPLLYP
ncbi:hypothetical protein [Helicobacter pametensis]|uniref:hypothetical protein n=1 Tax=Helicobacter pametensis TaxID=95149 RepID=UPI000486C1DC|nr:hypothetical protein [Helicobacter pametensis]